MGMAGARSARARIVVTLAVVAVLVTLLPAEPAHACSCAPPELTGVLEVAGPDQALVVAERTDLDGGADGTLRVLETLAGGPVDAQLEGRFDDGASCDPGMSGGTLAALVLERRDGAWGTTTCGQVGVGEALLAVDRPATADPGAGPPTLLLGGDFGGATLASVDAAGRVRAYAGEDGRTAAVAVCPEAETVVTLASTDEATRLHRWALPDLRPAGDPVTLVGRPVWQAGLRCADPEGEQVMAALPTDGAGGAVATVSGERVRLVDAPVHAVDQSGGTLAVALEDATGQPSRVAVVAADGSLTELASHPGTVFDRVAVSPSGDHVLAAGYPPDHEGDHLVIAAADGSSTVDRRHPEFVHLGWLGDGLAVLRGGHTGAFGAAVTSVDVVDLALDPVETREVGAGWEVVGLGDGVLTFGGVPPTLRRGEAVGVVADMRLVGTYVAEPIDPDAVLTEAEPTAEATGDPAPTTDDAPSPSPRAAPSTPSGDGWRPVDVLLVAATALALAGVATWGWRRRRP